MTDIPVQQILSAGVKPTYQAAAAGDTMPQTSNARRFFHVKNGAGVTRTVTIPKSSLSLNVAGYGGIAISDIVIAIPAGEERMIGPFSDLYKDGNGKIPINYDVITTVTVAAIELPSL